MNIWRSGCILACVVNACMLPITGARLGNGTDTPLTNGTLPPAVEDGHSTTTPIYSSSWATLSSFSWSPYSWSTTVAFKEGSHSSAILSNLTEILKADSNTTNRMDPTTGLGVTEKLPGNSTVENTGNTFASTTAETTPQSLFEGHHGNVGNTFASTTGESTSHSPFDGFHGNEAHSLSGMLGLLCTCVGVHVLQWWL